MTTSINASSRNGGLVGIPHGHDHHPRHYRDEPNDSLLSSSSSFSCWDGCFARNGRPRQQQQPQQQQQLQPWPTPFKQQQPQQQPFRKRSSFNDEDDAIVQALNGLSLQQRDQVYHDLHGIVKEKTSCSIIEENPDMIQLNVMKLDVELWIYSSPTSAYQQARNLSATYVQNQNFLLMFLRVEEWNVTKAAKRLIDFMEQKLSLFGLDKLCHDITLDDLDPSDIEFMNHGYMQVVPLPDRAGRPIVFNSDFFTSNGTLANRMKTSYYILMKLAQEYSATQKLGITVIDYGLSTTTTTTTTNSSSGSSGNGGNYYSGTGDTNHNNNKNQMTPVFEFWAKLPYKLTACHICTKSKMLKLLFNAVSIFGTPTLSRHKVHRGEPVEVLYHLASYGIPVAALPINMATGEWNTDYHLLWIQNQQDAETSGRNLQQNGGAGSSSTATSCSATTMTTAMTMNDPVADPAAPAAAGGSNGTVSDDIGLGYGLVDTVTSNWTLKEIVPSNIIAPTSSSATADQNGIDVGGGFSVTGTSSSTTVSHKDIVEVRRDCIIYPSNLKESDVLLGRGRVIDKYPGNVQFRTFLSQHAEEYDVLPTFMKRSYTKQLLSELRNEHKVRFLEQEYKFLSYDDNIPNDKGGISISRGRNDGGPGAWTWKHVTDDTVLLEKISRTIRRFRTKA